MKNIQKNAVSLMIALANAEKATLQALSEQIDVSVPYCEIMAKGLKESGLVIGIRGPGGGYRLAKKSTQITALDITSAVYQRERSKLKIWQDLGKLQDEYLKSVKLSDLI